MGNQKQIANSEEKKSREGHRQLPGCQRGLSNAASGGDRRYLVRQTILTTSADTTCPNTQETAGRTALAAPPLSANLEHKLNRSSLESHRRLPFNRPELANNQKTKESQSPFLFKDAKSKKKKKSTL